MPSWIGARDGEAGLGADGAGSPTVTKSQGVRRGAPLKIEDPGQGPRHYAALLADGTVFEIYPARPGRETGILRLGLAITGASATPPLAPGHHLLTDPDGRTIAIHSS
jgi:hypothetical protein